MAIIYDDVNRGPWRGMGSKIENVDATRVFLNHYKNYLFLKFVAQNPKSSLNEKIQAEREMLLCENKLDYWEKQPRFVLSAAITKIKVLKQQFGVDFGDLKYPTMAPKSAPAKKVPYHEFKKSK